MLSSHHHFHFLHAALIRVDPTGRPAPGGDMKKMIVIAITAALLLACAPLQLLNRAANTHTPASQDTPAAQTVVYYAFVEIPAAAIPEGSVVIMPDTLILAPAAAESAPAADTADRVRTALDAALHDPQNVWENKSLEIRSVTFSQGQAGVALEGELFGVGDVILISASWQILLTIFADPSVETAVVTLNDGCIGNLGISQSSHAKPAGYIYTRAEIEQFMADNAYP
jgi:hypothetical protein